MPKVFGFIIETTNYIFINSLNPDKHRLPTPLLINIISSSNHTMMLHLSNLFEYEIGEKLN